MNLESAGKMRVQMAVDHKGLRIFQKHSGGKNIRGGVEKLCFCLAVFLSVWAGSIGGCVASAEREPSEGFQEYEIKAAFLYNFAKFVEWPKESFQGNQSPLVLGILGKDPFGKALDSLNGKSVGGREFVVKRFSGLETLEPCHILFVTGPEQVHLARILKKVESLNVLTVSDIKGFCPAGGTIALFVEEKQVRFEVNVDAVQRTGLKLSSQLLKLARIFKEN